MTMDTDQISIPRLTEAGESDRAYHARLTYCMMGANRSLAKVRGQGDGKARVTNRLATLEGWSVRYGWQECAAAWDATLATLAARSAAEEYRRDLEAYRAKYKQLGSDLHTLARALMVRISRQLEATNGSATTLKDEEIAPALRQLAGVLTTAADLEAHALQLHLLIPQITQADE